MRRRVFTIVASASLFLLVITVSLWIRSYRFKDVRQSWVMLGRWHSVWLFPRGTLFYNNIPPTLRPDGQLHWWIKSSDDFNWSGDPWLLVRLIPYPPAGHAVLVIVPYRTLAILFAILPVIWLFTRRTGRAGHCPRCGYDLTGNTSGTCPECGSKIDAPEGQIMKTPLAALTFTLLISLNGCRKASQGSSTQAEITRIEISHGPCFGTCPVFTATFLPDGSVEYDGVRFTNLPGRHHGRVEPQEFERASRFIRDHNIMDLQPRYDSPVTDHATVTTTFWSNGHQKTIADYAESGPTELRQLEQLIDNLLTKTQWDQPVTSAPAQ